MKKRQLKEWVHQLVEESNIEVVKEIQLGETTVRLGKATDASFHKQGGSMIVQLISNVGSVGLDKRDVRALIGYIKKMMGYSYMPRLKEGFDLKKLEDAIKMFQKKIKKQGRVTNARDEEHLKKLIKVYKEMGGKKIKEEKLTENKVYSKKDGLKIVKKLQAKDKKIYKVDKQKATYGGKKVTMYNLYTKDKQKYSGNNLHGLDMARNSKGEAMYLVPIKESSGKQIAQTILQQLGGNKFIAMTGAKNLGFTNKGLQMKIGWNAKGVTHVIIDLDRGKDLYNIEFVKIRGVKRTTVKKLKGVYADQLGKIFTKYTGLRTRL